MASFAEFVALCQALANTASRLAKLRLVADFLRGLAPDQAAIAVTYLTGRAFPAADPRALGVRGLPEVTPALEPSLLLDDVAAAFAAVADAAGPGSRRAREARLTELARRATAAEHDVLWRIMTGNMRTGVSDGLVLEAIALATGARPASVRRASLFLGDLAAVAALGQGGGVQALDAAAPRLFVPLSPMLAEIASDFDAVLAAHGGRTALEYKYDGARIQLHRDRDRVAIWTRGLSNVTASLPDVVEVARRDLRGDPLILDGEVLAFDAAGRPLPFQELMRRFRRIRTSRRGRRRSRSRCSFSTACWRTTARSSTSRTRGDGKRWSRPPAAAISRSVPSSPRRKPARRSWPARSRPGTKG